MNQPAGLEFKTLATAEAAIAPAGAPVEPDQHGEIEALVAVTGVKDEVGDIIVPGAFRRTLGERPKPKVCLGHDWNRPVGKTLTIMELMPGDRRLPKKTADGQPWPKAAGALKAKWLANLDSDDGRSAYSAAKFFGPEESTFSIGYRTVRARQHGSTRHIHDLDLFEYGPVLNPANRLATLQLIKSDGELTIPVDSERQDFETGDDAMETKVRHVQDPDYWGLPLGTPITAGMKPKHGDDPTKGTSETRLRATSFFGSLPTSDQTYARQLSTKERMEYLDHRIAGDSHEEAAAKVRPPRPAPKLEPEPDKVETEPEKPDAEATPPPVKPKKARPWKITAKQKAALLSAEPGSATTYRRDEQGNRLYGGPYPHKRGLVARIHANTAYPLGKQGLVEAAYDGRHYLLTDAGERLRATLESEEAPAAPETPVVPEGVNASSEESALPYEIIRKPAKGNPTARVRYNGREYDVEATSGDSAQVTATSADGHVSATISGGSSRMPRSEQSKDRERALRAALEQADAANPASLEGEPTPTESVTVDGRTRASERIQARIAELEAIGYDQSSGSRGLAITTAVNMLRQFTAERVDVHASADGRFAAVNNGRTWVTIHTADGQSFPADAGMSPEQVDTALEQLSALDIPWDDDEVRRQRWSDPAVRQADQEAVRAILHPPGDAAPVESAPVAPEPTPPEPAVALAPELVDEAAALQDEVLGITEQPDGTIEVTEEVAARQERVAALIEADDSGTLDLGSRSTPELTTTRGELSDELRLQSVLASRQTEPKPTVLRSPAGQAERPPQRPGLAGAAEDYAEALKTGDTEAINRTKARLQSSLRRSRVTSDTARGLADHITGEGDDEAEALLTAARGLREESRTRRNAAAKRRRQARRLERVRIQSLIDKIDAELQTRAPAERFDDEPAGQQEPSARQRREERAESSRAAQAGESDTERRYGNKTVSAEKVEDSALTGTWYLSVNGLRVGMIRKSRVRTDDGGAWAYRATWTGQADDVTVPTFDEAMELFATRTEPPKKVQRSSWMKTTEVVPGKAPAGDEPGDLTNRVESANVPVVTSDQVRAASDDELATLLGAHAEDDQAIELILGELDRRQRDAEITTAISEDEQWRRLDELMAAGWDEESAVEEALGVSVEEQRRERAIAMLRGQGYTGARFDELARKSYRDYVAGAYRAAEDATRGHLLTREAQNAGIDPGQLFSGPEARARRWASDELKAWWDENERQTFEDHKARLLGGQAAHRGAEGAFLT